MHGLGDSGDTYLDFFDKHLRDAFPEEIEFRIVLPTATKRKVTSNFNVSFNSWFDIYN